MKHLIEYFSELRLFVDQDIFFTLTTIWRAWHNNRLNRQVVVKDRTRYLQPTGGHVSL